jgi:hypothetical protein
LPLNALSLIYASFLDRKAQECSASELFRPSLQDDPEAEGDSVTFDLKVEGGPSITVISDDSEALQASDIVFGTAN